MKHRIRHLVSLSNAPEWRRGFKELARRGLSYDLQLYYWQIEEFLELARDFPDVQIILNHTGMQIDGPSHFEGWRKAMKTLAQAPNVACKISGLGMGDWTWTTESIRPYVEEAIAAFGVERAAGSGMMYTCNCRFLCCQLLNL